MQNLISQLKAKNPDLKKAEIEGILHILLTEASLTNDGLIRLTGLPKETLKNFKSSISQFLESTTENNVLAKQEFLSELRELMPKPYKWSLFTLSDEQLAKKVDQIREDTPLLPKRDYDQFFATAETTVAKVKILAEKGMLTEKRIALLGDDDIVSLGIALNNVKPTNVTVFDIDSDILGSVGANLKNMNINSTRFVKYDARDALSPQFIGAFDAVMTDPPYTSSGIKLFLNRAVELLGKQESFEGKYIFLFYGNSFKTPEKTLKIQDIISKFNLAIEDRIDKFSRYYGAESIGSASALYILKTTPHTKPLGSFELGDKIYTYETAKEEKFPYVDHLVIKVLGVSEKTCTSKSAIFKLFGQFCNAHKLKVVDHKVTKFKGKGMSLTYILANSNLLVHTWPELCALHIDLVTCAPIYNKSGVAQTLSKLFDSAKIVVREIV